MSLWVIIGSVAIGKAGISNFIDLVHERDVLKASNTQTQIYNQHLESRIAELKSSEWAAEQYLTQNYGYIKNGAYLFQFSASSLKTASHPQAPSAHYAYQGLVGGNPTASAGQLP